MSAIPAAGRRTAAATPSPRLLDLGLAVFAVVYLAEALFMAVSPHAFYESIGGFDSYNPHYVRDVATFSAALGAGLAVAVARPSWRVPMLAVSTLQYGLHSINHLLDIDIAHPHWTGFLDFFSLLLATLALAWLLRTTIVHERAAPAAHNRRENHR